MPDLSGLGILLFAALGGFAGALLIIPLAIASIWIGGLMSWAAGMIIGSFLGRERR